MSFLLLILCQNIFCKISTRNVSETEIDQNLFSYVTLYFAAQRANMIPFFSGNEHQSNSVTTVLLHYIIVSSF